MATDARMDLEIGFGRVGQGRRRREPEAPLRVLVCADLAGDVKGAERLPLRERRPVRVDVDSFDRVLAAIAPRAEVALAGVQLDVAIEGIDDFHPDRLIRRLPEFATLRSLREELLDPATFERAAAALGAGPAASAHPKPQQARAADADSDVERLLGKRPPGVSPAAAGRTEGMLEDWIREMVAPHVVPGTDSRQPALLASLDAAISQQMRALLADSSFRRLESTWRGIDWLVRDFGGEEAIEIHLIDARIAELLDDVRDSASDLSGSAAWRQICGPDPANPDGHGWSIVVFDHEFGDGADDVALLAGLGGICANAGVALLAGADPRTLGCAGPQELNDAQAWVARDAGAAARWAALRAYEAAGSIGLACPRVLLRLPYGAKSDPVEAFGFEELGDPADPRGYLWGSAGWALAWLAAAAFREQGWEMDPDSSLEIADLPAYSYREDGAAKLRACTEALIGERSGERILAHGLMPLLGYPNRNALRLMRWQSIADPPAPLSGPWS